MKNSLFLLVILLPLMASALSCGSSSPNDPGSGSLNSGSPTTPTPTVKTFISSFPAFSAGVSLYGLTVDSSDNVYAANYNASGASSDLMKVTSAGAATSITQMNGLTDVVYTGSIWYGISSQNSPYIYSYNGSIVTQPISPSGGLNGIAVNSNATTIALSSGTAVTLYSLPTFNNPQNFTLPAAASGSEALAFDTSGNLYVAMGTLIAKYIVAGGSTTIAGGITAGYKDGSGTAAQFAAIDAIAVDSSGNVYAADAGNSAIREISSSGTVSTLVGPTGSGVSPIFTSPSLSNYLFGIAVDGSGNVFFSDENNAGSSKIFEYIP